jgi:hypothetical protein
MKLVPAAMNRLQFILPSMNIVQEPFVSADNKMMKITVDAKKQHVTSEFPEAGRPDR